MTAFDRLKEPGQTQNIYMDVNNNVVNSYFELLAFPTQCRKSSNKYTNCIPLGIALIMCD